MTLAVLKPSCSPHSGGGGRKIVMSLRSAWAISGVPSQTGRHSKTPPPKMKTKLKRAKHRVENGAGWWVTNTKSNQVQRSVSTLRRQSLAKQRAWPVLRERNLGGEGEGVILTGDAFLTCEMRSCHACSLNTHYFTCFWFVCFRIWMQVLEMWVRVRQILFGVGVGVDMACFLQHGRHPFPTPGNTLRWELKELGSVF